MEYNTNSSWSLTDRAMLAGGVVALLVLLAVAMKPQATPHERPPLASAGERTPAPATPAPDAPIAPDVTTTAPATDAGAALKAVMDQGEQLYHTCVMCHGMTGEGLPGQYPPLKNAPYVIGSEQRLARILLHGMEGPTHVDGKQYDMPMPAPPLTDDAEVAAVMTFIRNSFGNRASAVTPETVAQIREATKDRENSWTSRELNEIP